MEDKRKIVQLSDDALDNVSGGVLVREDCVLNMNTGESYPIISGNKHEIFGYVCNLGGTLSEEERIAALRAAGFIA